MSKTGTLARQGTFDTAPADTIKGNSIKRDGIEIPVVYSDPDLKSSSNKSKKTREKRNSLPDEGSVFKNVPPTSTSKPAGSNSKPSRQTGSNKTGALNSLNNKLSKEAASVKEKEDKSKGRSNSLSKNGRDESPSKYVNPSKTNDKRDERSGKLNSKRDESPSKSNNTKDINPSHYNGKRDESSQKTSDKRDESPKRSNDKRDESPKKSNNKRDESPSKYNGVSKRDSENTRLVKQTSNTSKTSYVNEREPQNSNDRLNNEQRRPSRPRDRNFSPSRYEDIHRPSPHEIANRHKKPDRSIGRDRNTDTTSSRRPSDPSTTERNGMSEHSSSYRDTDRRESFEQVRLERDGLIRAEAAYKKRIKQLEDEAKSFTKDIDDLSDENKRLNSRLDDLESRSVKDSDARRENREILGRCEKLEKENQGLWSDNQRLRSERSDLEQKVHRLTGDIESLQKTTDERIGRRNDEINELRDKLKKLDDEHHNLKTVNFDVEKKLAEVQSENKVLSESLGEKRKELEELMKALQNDKDVQKELNQSQTDLEKVRKNLSNVTREMERSQSKWKELESEKEKFSDQIKEKDNEIYSLKDSIRKKKTANSDLHAQIDTLKAEVERLKAENAELRLLRKDVSNLKDKVKSLNEEIDKKNEGNKKLRREKSDNKGLIEDLKRELATANAAITQAAEDGNEKVIAEQQAMKKMKEEMDRKSTYISKLETETFEMNMKFDSLNEKMRELERERKEWETKREQVLEIEESNRQFVEENKRLRQMLVERNMEVTNKTSEKTVLSSRLEKLERRQMDSDIRMKQMQGWVDGYKGDEEPIVVVTTTSLPEPGRTKPQKTKVKKPTVKRIDQKTKAASLSLEDLRHPELRLPSPRTPPSLPAVDYRLQSFGYYDIYKQKLKLMRERRF